ncbi:MAG: hydrogenobyrinic acid a,c-diamide synthase (glutamine-hydrolyzing) [Gammaproteobacteria bacterium]|nr:hydrogenobyrinic acid a,c-diamide synthase (glutamine-hydrolyzing) [Gammaproteobacteria bacterium]
MSHLLISAAHKSSGKTTVSIGLCAALTSTGKIVQPFKKGPDYIDPLWLARATGRACHNLDFYTMDRDEIKSVFVRNSAGSDLQLIEGNKGLYDGLDLDGSNSNAALAKLLKTPVVLVIDARGMTRGIAPLILGYQAFDTDIHIAGVILNQVGGLRHESKLRNVIEHYTDAKVLGAVQRDERLNIDERHLGLMPSNEFQQVSEKIGLLSDAVKQQVDLDQLIQLATQAEAVTEDNVIEIQQQTKVTDIRIGIVKNEAFGFYYPGDLQAFEACGAELVEIDTITDEQLPEIDGLFIGGGFPETLLTELESNQTMQQSIKDAIDNGLPTYAECGGLMYLCRNICWQGKTAKMVGVIPANSIMNEKPQGRGYVRLQVTDAFNWPIDAQEREQVVSAHEFHYSSLEGLPKDSDFAFDVIRGVGISGKKDGYIYKNLMACYSHMRDSRQNHWVSRFVQFVSDCKQQLNKERMK